MSIFSILLAQSAEPSGILGVINTVARTKLGYVLAVVAFCTVLRLILQPYLLKTAPHLRQGGFTVAKIFNEFLDAVIYAGVFVFLVIRPFLVQTFYIPSGSMLDTLQLQDYIIANKMIYRYSEPKHGDIVVFKPPKRALYEGQGDTDFIKRLIGKPGDVIEIREGELYRNGQKVSEPYLKDPRAESDFRLVQYQGNYIPLTVQGEYVNQDRNRTAKEFLIESPSEMEKIKALPPAKIPDGYLLFMGDNRNGSFDSRGWGLVPRESVIGRSELIWFPFGRWRITR